MSTRFARLRLPTRDDSPWPWIGASLIVIGLPLLVALIALHAHPWFPSLDVAVTEMQIRNAFGPDTPLVGLYSRIGSSRVTGNHPGPLSFYALWPVWRALGSTAFALQVSLVALDLAAIGICLWAGGRRGGPPLVIAVTAMLGVVIHAYGVFMLTWPWNPYLPVLWWVVFLLSVWSLLDGDRPMIVPAVVAGSFCAQTHISYLGLVGGMALLVVVHGIHRFWREPDPAERRTTLRWAGLGTVLGLVLWAPPAINQLTGSPGNVSILRGYFANPPSSSAGLRLGVSVLLAQMDPVRLVSSTVVIDDFPHVPTGSTVPAIVLLAVWAVLAVVARRRCGLMVRRLNLVIGTGLALGLISTVQIVGEPLDYLSLWAWTLSAMILLSIALTLATLLRSRVGVTAMATAGFAVALVVVVLSTTASTRAATRLTTATPRLNAALALVVPPTADAVREAVASRPDQAFVVTWATDPVSMGALGWGLINELRRRGFDANAPFEYEIYSDPLRPHVMDSSRAGLEVHIATGDKNIERWRKDPRSRELAHYEPRTALGKSLFAETRTKLIDALRRNGRDDLVKLVDTNLPSLAFSLQPGLERDLTGYLGAIGHPSAVFLRPKERVPNALGPGSGP